MALSKIKSSSMADTAIHGRRNLIINGAMTIDQRNSGSSVNLANDKVFAVDRFYWIENSSETPTGQQVTDAPNGFTHSVKITNTSTTTTPSYTQLVHRIEGNNVSQLYFGNSSAESVTLSFYVKSSLTGQFSASLRNGDSNRSNVSTYTINSANTWERKIITFVGDTTGTWATDTSVGLNIMFRLDDTGGTSSLNQWTATGDAFASGSVRFMGNASATWQITGVQLEVGEQATPFEHRSYGEELALCQRYYERVVYSSTVDYDPYGTSGRVLGSGVWYSASTVLADFQFRTTKRATAAVSVPDSSSILAYVGSNGRPSTDATPFDLMTQNNARINAGSWSTNGTLGHGAMVQLQDNKYVEIDAEL
jgi:hypothetical protein